MLKRFALALIACLWASLAFGQANNSNTWQTPGNQTVGGVVQMCVNASGQAVPCATAVAGAAGFPNGATPVANSATGTTGAVVATLPAAAGKFTYLCNFSINAAGSATISPVTIAGVLGGSITVQGLSAGGAPFMPPPYTPCLSSSAVNTAITITTTADATATAVDVAVSGFQQ